MTDILPAIFIVCEACHNRGCVPYAEVRLWQYFTIGYGTPKHRTFIACPHAPQTLPPVPTYFPTYPGNERPKE